MSIRSGRKSNAGSMFRDAPVPQHIKDQRRKAVACVLWLLAQLGSAIYATHVAEVALGKNAHRTDPQSLALQVLVACALVTITIVVPITLRLRKAWTGDGQEQPV